MSVADLGEGHGGPGAPFILGKKEEMTEGKRAIRARKSRPPPPPPPPLAQGLDPSLGVVPSMNLPSWAKMWVCLWLALCLMTEGRPKAGNMKRNVTRHNFLVSVGIKTIPH